MHIDRRKGLLTVVIGGLLLAATGCPGTLEDKDRFLADTDGAALDGGGDGADGPAADGATACGDVVARIFQPQCGSSGCHGAMAPQQALDLVSPGVAARVVGVTGKGCAGALADPSNPQASLLYSKLLARPPCGAQMPLAQPPLGSADVACILAWIAGQSAP